MNWYQRRFQAWLSAGGESRAARRVRNVSRAILGLWIFGIAAYLFGLIVFTWKGDWITAGVEMFAIACCSYSLSREWRRYKQLRPYWQFLLNKGNAPYTGNHERLP